MWPGGPEVCAPDLKSACLASLLLRFRGNSPLLEYLSCREAELGSGFYPLPGKAALCFY